MSIMADIPVTNAVDLGRRLRAERRALGFTQAELASRAGLSRQTIIDAESGRNVSVFVLMGMLAGLGKALRVTDARFSVEELQHVFADDDGEEVTDGQSQAARGPHAARPRR